jgi:hypothetical protein
LFRFADDFIVAAMSFSGVPVFIELLNIGAIGQRVDLLRDKIEALLF